MVIGTNCHSVTGPDRINTCRIKFLPLLCLSPFLSLFFFSLSPNVVENFRIKDKSYQFKCFNIIVVMYLCKPTCLHPVV